jgi:hypothetical protein
MQRQFYDCEFFCFGLSFCDVCGLRKRVAAFSRRSMSQHWGMQSVPSLALDVVECRKNPLRRSWVKHEVREHWMQYKRKRRASGM